MASSSMDVGQMRKWFTQAQYLLNTFDQHDHDRHVHIISIYISSSLMPTVV